jgi:hypothetical protein
MTAEACLRGGKFFINDFAQRKFSAVKLKLSG